MNVKFLWNVGVPYQTIRRHISVDSCLQKTSPYVRFIVTTASVRQTVPSIGRVISGRDMVRQNLNCLTPLAQ